MARVFFGLDWREGDDARRWLLVARIFLWTVLPFGAGVVLLTPAWWLSLLVLGVLCVVEFFLELNMNR